MGRPVFVNLLTAAVLVWVLLNLATLWRGTQPWDAPPFPWLQDTINLVALYTIVLILVTQRHEDQLSVYHKQLMLELVILSGQKSAKIITLLKEIRRDLPNLHNRVDPVAAALFHPANRQSVLDASKGKQEELAKQESL